MHNKRFTCGSFHVLPSIHQLYYDRFASFEIKLQPLSNYSNTCPQSLASVGLKNPHTHTHNIYCNVLCLVKKTSFLFWHSHASNPSLLPSASPPSSSIHLPGPSEAIKLFGGSIVVPPRCRLKSVPVARGARSLTRCQARRYQGSPPPDRRCKGAETAVYVFYTLPLSHFGEKTIVMLCELY